MTLGSHNFVNLSAIFQIIASFDPTDCFCSSLYDVKTLLFNHRVTSKPKN